MNRYWNPFVAVAALGLGLLAAAPAQAAALTMVPRATWGATGVPSYMQMYIYVPDRVATKPPIYISCHSCGSTATGQISNIPMAKAQADAQGFILILPDNPGNNCWAVGTTQGLTHDGGGDTHAARPDDPVRAPAVQRRPSPRLHHGGLGGRDVRASHAGHLPQPHQGRLGARGRCGGMLGGWLRSSNQWSNNCAAGNTNKTAQQWGDLVRGMYPGYTGHRPRIQLYHGDADTTINYKNMNESIEEWTNVLGLSMTPTSMDTGYMAAGAKFNRQFWKNSCGQTVIEAWTAPGATHSMTYEEAEMLKFFGLNAANVPDPEMDCTGSTGYGRHGRRDRSGGADRRGRDFGRRWPRRQHGHRWRARPAARRAPPARQAPLAPRAPPARRAPLARGRASPARRAPPARRAHRRHRRDQGRRHHRLAGTGAAASGTAAARPAAAPARARPAYKAVAVNRRSRRPGRAGRRNHRARTSPGGCACAVGSDAEHSGSPVALLLGAALTLVVRRRRRAQRPL